MLVARGKVVNGCGHFRLRIANYLHVFCSATREKDLFPGTLNIQVENNIPVPIREQFRIRGKDIINEPKQDLLFEVCRIYGLWAYRIRPFDLNTGGGGHGDHILEIICSQHIPNASIGSEVQVELFRDEIEPGLVWRKD
jgi:CTP-dependent riboflavin kinase